jgi:isopentenyl diphosphate isomerase/L-lactate dehydrogenase-like FMN-dependent dehydrogenase
MSKPVNVEDYRVLAQKRLPKMVFDYLEGSAEDETGLAHNRAVFQRVRLRSRRLVDVSGRDSSTTLFDKRISTPLLIAPTGLNGSFWPKGDIALARSAARFGIPFLLSTASNSSIEEVAEHADGDLWFQLYVVHRKLAEQLVRRAMDAGYSTLVLTVGSDVVKAIAAGASAVLLGRATLYGLAAAGESGVDDVLAIMKDEIDRTLAQLGCPNVEGLSRDYLAFPGSAGKTESVREK